MNSTVKLGIFLILLGIFHSYIVGPFFGIEFHGLDLGIWLGIVEMGMGGMLLYEKWKEK